MAKPTAKSLADQYGFSQAFFSSDPQLEALLNQAVKGNWTTDKFTAAYRDSKWFKTHGSTYRENLIQKTSDPATYASRLAQTTTALGQEATKMGAPLSTAQLQALSEHALLYGYTDNQIQNSLSAYIKMGNTGYFGDAGTNAQTLQQSAWRNGINISPGSLQTWVHQIALGQKTTSDFADYARQQAATLAPGLAGELKSGQDLYDLASPYMQSMATTLEIPSTSIDLFDPTIRNALNFTSPAAAGSDKAGAPSTMGLGQFETSLKQDPRWMKTQNAQDLFTQNAHSILSSFGFVS